MSAWWAATVLLLASGTAEADRAKDLAVLRKVGPDGKGSREAAAAWKRLASADARELPGLLAGMDGASALARNWLRSAIDHVLERAAEAKTPVPAKELEAFLGDRRHDPQARQLAYDLVCAADKTASERLLPGLLDDPSPDLRREAVTHLLARADTVFQSEKKAESLPLYRQALAAAREKAQIDQAARKLKDLGQPVDLAMHLGMILDWKFAGPFPNADQKGGDTAYPPEQKLDFTAEYEGKGGKVHWAEFVSKDPNGIIDVNAALAKCLPASDKKPGPFSEAVAYAATTFSSKEARDAEVRLGSFTSFKLWVNGELVLVRGDAYTGMSLDHYIAPVRLKAGENTLLLKVWLDVPPPQLPKVWRFQARVCDASGATILSATRPAPVENKGP